MNKLSSYILLILLAISCNKSQSNKFTQVEIPNKTYNFGKINIGDTITHSFILKNISNNILEVKKVATSCGCSSVGPIDSLISKNEILKLTMKYIPTDDQIGSVTNTLVVEMNTSPLLEYLN